MSLKYLTDSFLGRLRNGVAQNASRYSQGTTKWIDEFAAGARYCRETGVEVLALPTLETARGADDDAENAVRIYSSLAKLKPIQAMDERLWACLCHATYWDYMVSRWGTAKQDVIIDRFFLKQGGIGSLVRNGIARLWWSGYLTHDRNRQDPFELTRVLLSKQDIHTGLLQRSLGKSRTVRMATLEYLKISGARVELAGGWSKAVQRLMRDLNTAGGVYLLDALQQAQIQEILEGSLKRLAA